MSRPKALTRHLYRKDGNDDIDPEATLSCALITGAAWSQVVFSGSGPVSLPTYYAAFYGVVGDGVVDDCTAITALLSTVSATGVGGVVQLPRTGHYVKTTCDITIPPGVTLRGCGMDGNQLGTPVLAPCGINFTNTTGSYHIKMVGGSPPADYNGQCGLEDIALSDTSGSETFVFVGVCVPKIRRVSFHGKGTHNSTVNDGIVLGDNITHSCGYGSTASAYCGYGPGVIDDVYFSNTKTLITFGDNANAVRVDHLNSDQTCGDGIDGKTGYAILFNASSAALSTYGNVIGPMASVEMGYIVGMTTTEIYKGVVGAGAVVGTGYGYANVIQYTTGDYGAATNSTYILTTNFYGNKIICQGPSLSAGCVSDVSTNNGNEVEDIANSTHHVRTLDAVNLGDYTSSSYINWVGSQTWDPGKVSTLPASPYGVMTEWVSDSSDGTCTSGTGGTGVLVKCFFDGTGWKPMGNLSSPRFTSPNIGAATGTSLLATGTVDGTMPVSITTGSTTLGGSYKSGYTFNQGAAPVVTYTLPGGTLVAGQSYCIANSNNGSSVATSQLKLQPNTGQQIIFTNGMRTTSGTGYLETTVGAGGDEICVVLVTSGFWQVTGTPRGAWMRY